MRNSTLFPCPGCGALFPPHDGPTHRYIGASSGCWALFCWSIASGGADIVSDLVTQSRISDGVMPAPAASAAQSLDSAFGDAYAVQHHGEDSPQAIQSVACHLLDLHAIIAGHTTEPGWAIGLVLRVRGVFHKLDAPPRGSAFTSRHLFPGGGVVAPITRSLIDQISR